MLIPVKNRLLAGRDAATTSRRLAALISLIFHHQSALAIDIVRLIRIDLHWDPLRIILEVGKISLSILINWILTEAKPRKRSHTLNKLKSSYELALERRWQKRCIKFRKKFESRREMKNWRSKKWASVLLMVFSILVYQCEALSLVYWHPPTLR